jgi:hypothetical protein
VRGVENKAHKHTSKSTRNWDGDDPCEDKEANSLPVDGLDGTVAETDTDGSTSDAHGGGDGKGELGEDEDGDGGTHLHRATSAWGVVRDLVTHNCWRNRVSKKCIKVGNWKSGLPFMML